ncbi:SIS domain-containing protein [Virgibacillus dakarensis]|uniref:Fructosamine deglycase n=1 Tax=Lentibacillus populi TaxID=1827502 RepID=A0A9W5TWW0_9BACI|nr:SIS domain-containing protein [Lentibacillus populi]MTW85818.1 SIS domain-containing protein [Virgibacillus dakarensis]GGB39225.1 fructosamine deglycase FrlB [Lentibacillus populi]
MIKNYTGQTAISKTLEELKDKDINRVFYVACGGSSALTYSSKYIIERDSKILAAEVYNSNEFIYRSPATLDEKSLVVVISHLGNTPETTAAAEFARDKGATTVAFTYENESPLAKASDFRIDYQYGPQVNPADSRNILIIQLTLGLLKIKEGHHKYDALVSSLPGLQYTVDKAIEKYTEKSIDFATKYQNEKMIYTMASGSNFGVAYTFAICILMEAQWINSHAIHAGEFFHGPFEVVDKDTPFVLLLGLDETRYMEERAQKFLNKYGEKLFILDAKDFDLSKIDIAIEGEIASVLHLYVLRALSREFAKVRNHPLETRRYMHKVEY